MANPPYSIKAWDRKSFENDPYGRNLWGTPPQGCADFAFEQHIQKSLNDKNGRSISLWPQGMLDRNSESHIRENFIKSDRIEAVIGLGRNLFYNSGMESCLIVTRTNKSKKNKSKILFINASDLVKKEKTISYLEPEHISTIYSAFKNCNEILGLAKLIDISEVLKNNSSLNINLYVNRYETLNEDSFEGDFENWTQKGIELNESMSLLFKTI